MRDLEPCLNFSHEFRVVGQVLTVTLRVASSNVGSGGNSRDGGRCARPSGKDGNAAESEDVEECKEFGEHCWMLG